MTERLEFTTEEKEETLALYQKIREEVAPTMHEGDEERMRHDMLQALETKQLQRDVFGLNPILLSFQTAQLVVDEIGLKRDSVLAVLLRPSVEEGLMSIDEVKDQFGESVARILHGLQRIQELYQKNPVIESENFRNLLLSFAEDMRVILIMIADRVNLMRQINEERVGRPVAEIPGARRLLPYQGKAERDEKEPRRLHRALYRPYQSATYGGRHQVSASS